MTPFEAATELYYHTATHPAAAGAMGQQGDVNAARMFKLARDQKLSEQAGERQRQNMLTEASIQDNQRLKLKNEAANKLFASTKQLAPGFTVDPTKSLDDNVAAANAAQGEVSLGGFKDAVDARDKAQQDYEALLDRVGAYKPIDATRLNNSLLQDLHWLVFLTTEDGKCLGMVSCPMMSRDLFTQRLLVRLCSHPLNRRAKPSRPSKCKWPS